MAKDELDELPTEYNAAEELKQRRLAANNKILKEKNDALLKALQEAEDRADAIAGIQSEPDRRKWEKLTAKQSKGSTAIVGLMDWHTEERVDGETIKAADGTYTNHFNLEIAEKRVKRTFEKAVYLLEFARNIARIDDLVLAVLGDLITGYIHQELERSNYLSPTESCLFVQDMLCTGIDYLLKHASIKSIVVPCCHGNHGRTDPHRLVSVSHKNSFEWQLYHQIARHYRNEPRVSFKIEDGIHNWVNIQGRKVRMHHGDNLKYNGGVGGLTIPVNKAIAQWNKRDRADLDIFGHYHTFIDHWDWICSGCLVGFNAYANSIKADYQPPTQLFAVISREYGKVMAVPIFCEEGKKA